MYTRVERAKRSKDHGTRRARKQLSLSLCLSLATDKQAEKQGELRGRRRKRSNEERWSRECIRFVGCVDASGIIYDVQRQYVSEITIGPLLSAIKNTFSTFIRQINLDPMECDPPVLSCFIGGSSLSSLISRLVLFWEQMNGPC